MRTYSIHYFLKKTLVLLGLTAVLFFPGMTRFTEVHAQQSLLEATSININGEAWTFRTPPPPANQRTVISSHPRLFLTQANLPEMRTKLADSVYSADITTLRGDADNGDAIANAFLYQLEGDVSRGNVAKNWLLSGSFDPVPRLDKAGQLVEPILVFDWVFPLLSSSEKTAAFNRLKSNFSYDHRTATDRDVSRYWNDVWSRHQELHYPIMALAIAGDGIDDGWAQEVLDLVYNESPLLMGPYGPNRGSGFLDMLASVSLDDGGGAQVGSYDKLGNGYYAMFLHAFLPMASWETATGQAMWSRSDYFRKLPFYWAYEKSKTPENLGVALPEMLTGIYRNIDPDAAALARWMMNKWDRHKSALVYRLILGDLRVAPKSPQELGLPTAKYIRGADMFTSSRSWDEDAVTLTAYSRYLDTGRFEPDSGAFSIVRGLEPLAVQAEPNKTKISEGYLSGLWIYDSSDVGGTRFQKSTYQDDPRAFDAYTAVSNSAYFPGGPDNIIINSTYRAISTEYSKLSKAPGVRTARQTIVHIIDPNRDFIVVYHYTDVPSNLSRAWSMRLAVTPSINGNAYSIPGMYTTVVAPTNHTMTWVGGPNDEFKSPPPEKEWYGNNRSGNGPGFASDPGKAKANGIGNLFVQAQNPPEQLEFLVVIEAGTQSPVTVARISDREVRFGDWQVTFTSGGNVTVVNTGSSPPDTTAPDPPLNFGAQ